MECENGVCFMKPKQNAGLRANVFQVDKDNLTLEWSPKKLYERVQVDMKEDGADWRVLSDKLTSGFMKKNNLRPGSKYWFKVRGFRNGDWSDFTSEVEVQVPEVEPLKAPTVVSCSAQDDGQFVATLKWDGLPTAVRYAVEMRNMQDDNLEWKMLTENISGPAIRKKNLPPSNDLVFRYRADIGGQWTPWSLVSQPLATSSVNQYMRGILGNTLMRGSERVNVDSLAGKVVALYFSASWCPPCRQQTQFMLQYYPGLKNLPFEIVFVSADRDPGSFQEYFKKMGWTALPYEAPQRNQAMQQFQINGIPKLMVFSPQGKLLVDNAVGMPLTPQQIETWSRM